MKVFNDYDYIVIDYYYDYIASGNDDYLRLRNQLQSITITIAPCLVLG